MNETKWPSLGPLKPLRSLPPQTDRGRLLLFLAELYERAERYEVAVQSWNAASVGEVDRITLELALCCGSRLSITMTKPR